MIIEKKIKPKPKARRATKRRKKTKKPSSKTSFYFAKIRNFFTKSIFLSLAKFFTAFLLFFILCLIGFKIFFSDEKQILLPIKFENDHSIRMKLPVYSFDLLPLFDGNKSYKDFFIARGSTSKKPKLAIVIDDVSFLWQVRSILNIGYPITPSFLPPSSKHPDSASIAQNIGFIMVHLPLEASDFSNPEDDTLLISDNYERIYKKLSSLKELYPDAKYYNNHTGSKFSSDFAAMKRLYHAMDELDLIFVDSRTTPKTQAPYVAKMYNKNLLSRDVFLDNSLDEDKIKDQLFEAVRIAKEKGFSIAIGHPHKKTLKVLKEQKKTLLKQVEPVYLFELDK